MKLPLRIPVILFFLLVGLLLPPWAVISQQLISQPLQSQPPKNYMATGSGGAVASVDARATQIGIDVLRQGGNAVDAAIATAAALGVVEPFSAGIGGGGFMVIYSQETDQAITLDGREEAPATVTPDVFTDPDSPTGEPLPFFPNRISSGLAVGVPGSPLNWETALRRYGSLSLAEALAPAIALAENGFEVDATFAAQVARNQERFAAFTSTRDLYLPNGAPPAVGSTFYNPDLAKTYRLLAEEGSNVFYRGEISEAIVDTVQNPPSVVNPSFEPLPGGMTLADLDRYEVRVRPPVEFAYRGYRFYGMGLPSSGGVTVAQTLNLLSEEALGALEAAEAQHVILEAERLAYGDRNAYLGDPEYVDVPLEGLLNPQYASQRRLEIPLQAPENVADFRAAPGNPLPFQSDPSPSRTAPVSVVSQVDSQEGLSTTHLTVADRFGYVVAYTLTIETTGGSGIVVPGYGFLLNNELTDFDPVVPHPNTPEAGKRPRSSMAPTIVVASDGSVLAFGSPGGSTIITTVLGIATNLLDFGLSLEEAIAAPRLSQRNSGVTLAEKALENSPLAAALRELGHELSYTEEIGAATGVFVNRNGAMTAMAEPVRRGGGSGMTAQ